MKRLRNRSRREALITLDSQYFRDENRGKPGALTLWGRERRDVDDELMERYKECKDFNRRIGLRDGIVITSAPEPAAPPKDPENPDPSPKTKTEKPKTPRRGRGSGTQGKEEVNS